MTFLNPWFLLGTMLAGVPVLIHLWYRRRLRRISFSTLRFLKKTEAVRFGWLRLREWLILGLRCLFIVLLFMGLARPQLESTVFGAGKLSSVCLIVDNSYSMRYGENFEKMKELAEKIVERYSSRSEFCLLPICEYADEEPFWMTRTSAFAAVKNIRLTYGRGSVSRAVNRAPITGAKNKIEYVYIGDGQSHNFVDFPVSKTEGTPFYWVRIPAGSNVGLMRVVLKDPVAIVREECELRATAMNYSPRSWSGKISVTSGDLYFEQDFAVPPGEDHSTDIALPSGRLIGKAEIFLDSLPIDNIYYFSKSLLQSISVLLVGNNSYITDALTAGDDSGTRFTVKSVAQIGALDLRRYQVVILDRITEVSNAEKNRLLNYANMPNTALIIAIGDDVGQNLGELLPSGCRYTENVIPKGYVTVDWIDLEHPIFMIFGPDRPLSDVQYFRYAKMIGEKGVVARFSSGDPFMIVNENLCILAGALDGRNTNFVFKNSFVPFLLRTLTDLLSGQDRKEYNVGEAFEGYGHVRSPNGELLNRGDRYSIPGFHVADSETVCVNVDPIEGDLRMLGHERAEILGLREVDAEDSVTGSDLTNLFLIIALFALAFEVGLLLLR